MLGPIWDDTLGDSRVVVAVLDGPVDMTHESLRDAEITQLGTFQPHGGIASRHGTHVASIIFGQHDGPVRGIAPRCRGLMIPVFSDDNGAGDPVASQADLAAAITTALQHGAHVINISAGEYSPNDFVDPRLAEAIRACSDAGALVVAAAGDKGCCRPQIPSSLGEVLAVATTETESPSMEGCDHKSNCIIAPGTEILGAVPEGGVIPASGTSFATAITSGVAALLLSLQAREGRETGAAAIRQVMLGSARLGRDLDPQHAVRLLQRGLSAPSAATESSNGRAELLLTALDGMRYAVNPSALRRKFGGVLAKDFGTTTVRLPAGGAYRVADFHYILDGGRMGMRLIPASDEQAVVLSDGTSVGGSEVLDAILRCDMHLGDGDPVFAILSYIHPEEHAYDVAALPRSSKLQLAHRHVGSYLGGGRTTHALTRPDRWRGQGPLHMGLNVDSHPANVQVVSLRGVPQAVLNRNAHNVDVVVAGSAKVPRDADNITDCRTIDLTTIFQYYRDVIRQAEYLDDLAWYTNCSVHKMIVVNVFLNLPHNAAAFAETFGQDGPAVWADFRRRYEAVTGTPFTTEMETAFTPLWKLAELPPDAIRPLTLREYLAHHAAGDEARSLGYTGRTPLPPNVGLAWPLENLVDLLAEFINTHTPFERVGGIVTSAEILLLGDVLAERIGVELPTYTASVTPIIGRILAAEAMRRGPMAGPWLGAAARQLLWTARVRPSDTHLRVATEVCVSAAKQELAALWQHGAPSMHDAAAWLEEAVRPELERLRGQLMKLGVRTGYFASPSVFHRIALGTYPRSPFVEIRTICTAMDAADLVEIPDRQPMR
ncbi:S8 family serine peptidase [Arthrobacter sp.]|uniref:S8 family serine peptidase n=1 Tax=Arthrobacter sp. TaxID=1667 RepID=UPI0033922AA4